MAIGLAVVLGILVLFAIDRRPRTHDARIFAYSAAMASEISGRIVQILVTNDQDVAKGAPLLVIDPVPYELQLRQACAQVAALKAQIARRDAKSPPRVPASKWLKARCRRHATSYGTPRTHASALSRW